MSELSLGEVVEQLRESQFPELSAELVKEVLSIEAACLEDRGPAAARVEGAIDRHVQGIV
jgi:hypothetical protein